MSDHTPSVNFLPEIRAMELKIPKTGTVSRSVAYKPLIVRRCYKSAEDVPADWFVFAFVRHPLERLVSIWADQYRRKDTFERFVDRALTGQYGPNRHWLPQSGLLKYAPRIDFLGRYERLAEDWAVLRERFPDFKRLPHKNRSKHRPWQEHYTPALLRQAADYYAADLEALGYEVEVRAWH